MKKLLSYFLSILMVFSVLTTVPLSAFAVETPEKGTLTFSPAYGQIENYQGRTSFIVTVPIVSGGTEADNNEVVDALKNNALKVVFTVRDEDTALENSYTYRARDISYELPGYCWRLPVAEYGYMPIPGHAHTLTLKIYDGSTLLYKGSSAVGAFAPDTSKGSAAVDFLTNGPKTLNIDINKESSLAGKSILFAGDSITEAICERYNSDTSPIAGWPGRVGTANFMRFVNAGVSGATISLVNDWNETSWNESNIDSDDRNVVLTQLRKNKNTKFDIVILHGGVNDAWCNTEVGTITESNVTDRSVFDITTFAGGLEYTFSYAKEVYADAKFGFIINFALPSSTNGRTADMNEYFAVARQICDKWDIPYLDLYANEEVAKRLQPTTTYALGDYVHPNNRGYDILFPYVEQFVKAIDEGQDPQTLTDPEYNGPVLNGTELLPTDVDVAVGKAATDANRNTSSAVNDGNLASATDFGAIGQNNCYAQLDLGGIYDIDKVNVYSGGVNFLYKYDILVSLDGEEWITVGNKNDDNMEFPNGYTVGFEKVSARYVRVLGKYCNKSDKFNVAEIAVYGVFNEGKTFEGKNLTAAVPENVKLPDDTATTSKLHDGNKTSDPLTIGVIYGGTITADMLEEKNISELRCFLAESNSAFSIFGSHDGETWTKLGSKALNDKTQNEAGKGQYASFKVDGSYRYISVRWDDSERNDGYVGLAEVEVYDQTGNEISKSGWKISTTNSVYSSGFDGNYTSYAFLKKRTAGITIDLGTEKTVYKVAGFVTDKKMTYRVLYSVDGKDFQGFGNVIYNANYNAEKGYVLYGEVNARYLRIIPIDYVNDSFGMYEVEITVDAHVHDYTGDWNYDETDHWKVCCSDTNCNSIDKKGAHAFDKGVVTTKPTVSETGIKTYTCTTCKMTKEEILPVDPTADMTDLAYGKVAYTYSKNSKEAEYYILKKVSALTDGNISSDNWLYGDFGTMYALVDLGKSYAIGGISVVSYWTTSNSYQMSYRIYVSNDNVHFTQVQSIVKAEHSEEGYKVLFDMTSARYIKIVADYYITSKQFSFREIQAWGVELDSANGHVHSYGDWTCTSDTHCKKCSSCDKMLEQGTHTFGDGVLSIDSTEKTYTCTECGYTKIVKVSYINVADQAHGATGQYGEGALYTDNLLNGKKDSYALLKEGENCWAIIDLKSNYRIRRIDVYLASHTYEFDAYASIDGNDWVKLGSIVEDKETYAANSNCYSIDANGSYRYIKIVGTKCSNGWLAPTEIEVMADPNAYPNDCSHVAGEWVCVDEYHYKYCTLCGKPMEQSKHDYDNGEVKIFPTTAASGIKLYTCKCCHTTKVESISAKELSQLGNNLSSGKYAWAWTTTQPERNNDNAVFEKKEIKGFTNGNLNDDNWIYGKFGNLYAVIDLGAKCSVDAVNIVGYSGSTNAWSVWVSNDGENYTNVAFVDKTVHPDTEGVTVVFDAVDARYIKIIAEFYGGATGQIDFREITVFGFEKIKGDVNDDGVVNIADVSALLNYLAVKSIDETGDIDIYDINGNGNIAIDDVSALLNILATGQV